MKYFNHAGIILMGVLISTPGFAGNTSCYIQDWAIKKYGLSNCDFDAIKAKFTATEYVQDVWVLKLDDSTGIGEQVDIQNEKMSSMFKTKQPPLWKDGYLTVPMRFISKSNILEQMPIEGKPNLCAWIYDAKKTKEGIKAKYKGYKGNCEKDQIETAKEMQDNWIKVAN
jgi:hypothetical protein